VLNFVPFVSMGTSKELFNFSFWVPLKTSFIPYWKHLEVNALQDSRICTMEQSNSSTYESRYLYRVIRVYVSRSQIRLILLIKLRYHIGIRYEVPSVSNQCKLGDLLGVFHHLDSNIPRSASHVFLKVVSRDWARTNLSECAIILNLVET